MADKIERSRMTQTDSNGKVIRAPRDNSMAAESVNFRWWTLDETLMAPAIVGTLKFIREHQGDRLDMLTMATRLLGNNSLYSGQGSVFSRMSSLNSNPMNQRISYNIVGSIVDTLESKMAKNKVVPTFVTNGGLWDVQKKAKQLTKFTQGLFYEHNMHKKSIHAWRDAAAWGDGFLHIYDKEDRCCVERVLPHELFVDMIETMVGPPQQMHRVKTIDRDIAYELYPELEESIRLVSPATYQEIGGYGTASDLITIIESWHLKSGRNATDGVHAISIGDGCLAEDYEEDYFPFAHTRYSKRDLGYYGQGVPERVKNLQYEINRSMMLKQQALRMQSAFKVLVEQGSKVVTQHLSDEVGAIIHFTGTPPQYITPPATNPELQQWIDSLVAYAYQQEGVSKLQTTGETPMGVESGKAMRTLMQVSDDRFLFMAQEMEDFTLNIAKQCINVVKKIYSHKKKYEIIFPDSRFLETIDWGDINLSESEYVLKAFPTSSLSDDLTGRLSEIQELAQAGMISPRTARRQLDMPDLEVEEALANAAEDRLHQIFEDMLHDGLMTRFEPGFHDAQLGQQLALEYINYAQYLKCPEERISLVRDFIAQMQNEVLNPPMPAAPPGMPAGGPGIGAPQANPAATPTSQMVPNTPQGGQ